MKHVQPFNNGVWAIALCTLVAFTYAGTASTQPTLEGAQGVCSLQASWVSEVDIGARFFTTYMRGATATGGPMVIEWIIGDPTLFGTFPTAVGLTQATGSWRHKGPHTYEYTWIGYGLDSAGIPLYAWKGSGTGTIQGCDEIVFDYVIELFPFPLNPLFDDPMGCLSGFGNKSRIRVELAACP